MTMEVINSVNMTKKDMFNAKSSSSNVKDFIGVTLNVTGAFITHDSDSDKTIGYVSTNEGVFGFTSGVLLDSMSDLIDYIKDCVNDDGSMTESVNIIFKTSTSKGGREFYTMEIV